MCNPAEKVLAGDPHRGSLMAADSHRPRMGQTGLELTDKSDMDVRKTLKHQERK